MRWILLVAILVFLCGQIMRMRPGKRDQQLQVLRKMASQQGLVVRFWTLRNSGYTYRHLPESGFVYLLPWSKKDRSAKLSWAVWLSDSGEVVAIAGRVPELAQQWLNSFGMTFSNAWALLECNEAGIGLLWQERGSSEDVKNIAEALLLLRNNLDALPG